MTSGVGISPSIAFCGYIGEEVTDVFSGNYAGILWPVLVLSIPLKVGQYDAVVLKSVW